MKKMFILAAILLAVLGCRKNETTSSEAVDASATTSSTSTDPHSRTDPSAIGAIEMMSNAGSLDTADIRYDLPAGWIRQAPTSSMRLDQATIPGPGGEGQLAVFFFGVGGGGGVDANLERWAAQVQNEVEPKRESFEANGFRVSMIEVEGTLLPSGMGAGPSEPQPDSILLGAVVEGSGGPWFFKATGPKATMVPQHDAFVSMLKSARANL